MRKRSLIPQVVACAIFCIALSSCTSRTILSGADSDSGDRMKVWFVRQAGDELRLVPVWREASSSDRLKEAVEELLKGPTDEEMAAGLGSEIPRGTILLGTHPAGGDVELNLSRRFASGGGARSLETRIDQLSRTVADCAGGKKVFLSVEGERIYTAAGDGLEIKQPLN